MPPSPPPLPPPPPFPPLLLLAFSRSCFGTRIRTRTRKNMNIPNTLYTEFLILIYATRTLLYEKKKMRTTALPHYTTIPKIATICTILYINRLRS